MGCHPYIRCTVAVLCLVLLPFAEVGAREANKPGAANELSGGKAVNVQYSFDFNGISNDLIRRNYVKINYNLHKNKLFNFSVLMNKDWDGVKVAEPARLPLDGSLAEIGLFNLYSPNHNSKGDIKAQLVIYITGVPKDISAAGYMDKQVPLMLKGQKFKTIQSKARDTSLGPTKDILISYSVNNTAFLSRVCAFKVKDDTKKYLLGEKHLLYLIQMSVQEKDYEKSGAEAFYLAKISFQPE